MQSKLVGVEKIKVTSLLPTSITSYSAFSTYYLDRIYRIERVAVTRLRQTDLLSVNCEQDLLNRVKELTFTT